MFDYLAVSGRIDDRVTEFVDHLHEHFVDPCIVRRGRYIAPTTAGYSSTIKADSRAAYSYPDGPVWRELAQAAAPMKIT
jgi:L-fuconate dehydratase